MPQLTIESLLQQAIEHHRASRFSEAEALYRRVLQADPDHAEALRLVGVLALQVGKPDIAVQLLQRVIVINPLSATAYWDLGRALAAMRNADGALAAYQRALELKPDVAEIWNDLGNLLLTSGKADQAVAAYERAITLKRDLPDAWNNLGLARSELGESASAIEAFQKALELRPFYPEAHNNLGNTLQQNSAHEKAIAEYENAITQRPTYAQAYNNMGRALRMLDRGEDATAAFQKCLELQPDLAEGHNSLGTALLDWCRIEESIASFRRAVELRPDYADAHHNLGRVLLLNGDFADGWNEYEWRWRMPSIVRGYQPLPQPLWDGGSLAGQTILLHAEQGFGDTIQFVRFAPLVKSCDGRVMLAVQKELGELLRHCEGIDELIVEGQTLPSFEVRAPLLSLPRILGTNLEMIPSTVPYLSADPEKVHQWNERLVEQQGRFKIGLIWAGRPNYMEDRQRSMTLQTLSPILNLPGCVFHSLQLGDASRQAEEMKQVKGWSGEIQDFSDTAALLKNLDLLISVDTATAHLAGAMGIDVWVLLPFSPDWRWMLGREDSPWYPTMKLFRQEKPGEWDIPVQKVIQNLSARMAQ